jgi:hypothetical protein
MKRIALLCWSFLLTHVAHAVPMTPRETADVAAKGSWSVGLFNPLRWAPIDGLEVETHPLVWLGAPHVTARWRHFDSGAGGWRLTGEYGFGVTTGAWTAAKPLGLSGDLVPSCKVAAAEPERANWCVRPERVWVPSLGLALSKGWLDGGQERGVLTVRADVSKGLGVDRAQPLDAWAPVNQQLAPWVGGARARLRVGYDHALLDALRLRAEVGLYGLHQPDGRDLSPWSTSVYLGADLRTTEHTRLTAGAVWWNADSHAVEVVKGPDGYARTERARTNEVWPTVDFIWRY